MNYTKGGQINAVKRSSRTVQLWFADHAEKYGIKPSQNIKSGSKRVRGYTGLKVKSEWLSSDKITL